MTFEEAARTAHYLRTLHYDVEQRYEYAKRGARDGHQPAAAAYAYFVEKHEGELAALIEAIRWADAEEQAAREKAGER